MNVSEAKSDLGVLDNIIRTADRTLHMSPLVLIAWGLVGTLINGLHQARAVGLTVPPDQLVALPVIAVALAATLWSGKSTQSERRTLMDAHAGVVFLVVAVVLLLVNVTAQGTIVPHQAMGLFWSAGFGMAALIVGLQSSRPLLFGGIAVIASCVVASLVPEWFGGLLALGWLAGFVVPGVVLAWSRSDGRTPAV